MADYKCKHIETKIHGRYLIDVPERKGPFSLLVGFHGYGETAENQMDMLLKIADKKNWMCCSIQGLHSFYNSKRNMGSSWMTREDREIRIQENLDYVNRVISSLHKDYLLNDKIVYHGFSQGTGMAVRSAVFSDYPAERIMLLCGDIPPEVEKLSVLRGVLIGRGLKDRWYTEEKCNKDLTCFEKDGVSVTQCVFEGGHGGHDEYFKAASEFLKKNSPQKSQRV